MGDVMQAYGHYSFQLANLKGAEGIKNFFRATLPSSSTEIADNKAWGGRWTPEPIMGGGHQVSWQPVTLTRYLDDNLALYEWYKEVMEKGATADTRVDTTITCLNNEEPLFTWALTGAVITNYSHSDADAQNHGLLTETVTLKYDFAELKQGGG